MVVPVTIAQPLPTYSSDMKQILENQVAFITGAGSGLGAAAARRLAADGALIAVNDLDLASAQRIADEVGGIAYAFDVTDSAAFTSAVDDAVKKLGRLDVMINNAGIAPNDTASKMDLLIENTAKRMGGQIDQMSPMNYLCDLNDESWDRMIKVHLYGAFYGCRAALTHMQPQKSGRIINISSVLGLYPAAGAPHYSVAKAGIITLTKAVAAEVAALGINVNAICPGYIRTPLLTPFSETMMAGITMRIGKGRLGEPEELADMIRFLSGPESEYCTGDVFNVSGGYTG
jgi:NAD(P)-dependent dehydrogenase (short-subunit alcohol dehydrogenase family)